MPPPVITAMAYIYIYIYIYIYYTTLHQYFSIFLSPLIPLTYYYAFSYGHFYVVFDYSLRGNILRGGRNMELYVEGSIDRKILANNTSNKKNWREDNSHSFFSLFGLNNVSFRSFITALPL